MTGDNVVPSTDHLRMPKRDPAEVDARDRDAVRAVCLAAAGRPDRAEWLNEQIRVLGLLEVAIAMRDEGRADALRRRIRPVVPKKRTNAWHGTPAAVAAGCRCARCQKARPR